MMTGPGSNVQDLGKALAKAFFGEFTMVPLFYLYLLLQKEITTINVC